MEKIESLNAFLYCFYFAPAPGCPLCLVPETVPQYPLARPRYRRQRLHLIRRSGTARLTLRLLLAAKSDPKPVLTFVRDTKHFPRHSL
ncbi:hypothetical protein B0H19DRAFT_1256538 [Mycena capillaripes]|nr:hypothetical protein B0H19DRAFT_1256538 [Mycena capillaripes]